MKRKWIQSALRNSKKGALSRQLGIPIEENIPISLLEDIIRRENKEIIYYKGRRIVVTPLLTRRANLALNLKKMKR